MNYKSEHVKETCTRACLTAGITVLLMACMPALNADADLGESKLLDQYSYNLGGFSSFAEIVSLGIKKMALSAALPSAEMDALVDAARDIAVTARVEIYREPDFLVSDLFPVAATDGKHVIIIYQRSTLDEYLALKNRKSELVASGLYAGKAREEITWGLGKLLSYPDAKIVELVVENADKEP